MIHFSSICVTLAVLCYLGISDACTNFIATRAVTDDSSTILAYNADSSTLYGQLYSYPAQKNIPKGTMRKIFDWDSGNYLGMIPEAENTYNVIGNMNEYGLSISETTYGGVAALQKQPGAIMDYGNLEWVTLQRAKTARDAIHIIDDLMQTYGYASEGESFSISDSSESWIMEIIGKGSLSSTENKLGSVWVARKIPDGSICAHANQARITTFPKDNPEDTLYAADVISFAREIGLYTGSDDAFSFSDVYDPLTFTGARMCEARVWSLFGKVMGPAWMSQYEDYASGFNLTNRMPLYVQPPSNVKLTVPNVLQMMRDHYDGTSLDMSGSSFSDIGASNANIPYRAHPLTWTSNNKQYFNERPVGTQQTGFSFVAQSRHWMPAPLRGVLWFGVDDSSTTAHLPVYGSTTRAPKEYAGKGPQDGVVPPMMMFDMRSAFYAFNVVANWVYTRWGLMYPDLHAAILTTESAFATELKQMDMKALHVLETEGYSACVERVTAWSSELATNLITQWNALFGNLFVKYRDGYVITPNAQNLACGCSAAAAPYPQPWYDDIASSTGSHLQIPQQAESQNDDGVGLVNNDFKPIPKTSVLQRR